MAVLLAVLYSFSHLAADNEITAMRASGVSVYQVLAPVLAWGACMAAFNFAFVDQVLPRTNARLRTLLIDIGRKKPTFELREQVINEVPPSQYFLRAGRIDAATGHLKDVTIYDVGGESSRRIIYADSGQMAYAEGQTDLSLRLYDGSIHQYRPAEPETFQLTYFHVNDIRVKNVFDELERNTTEAVRGDREMSTCEMLSVIHDARREQGDAVRDRHDLLVSDLRTLLALPPSRPSSTGQYPPAVAPLLPLDRVGPDPRSTQDGAGPGTRTESTCSGRSQEDISTGQPGPARPSRATAARRCPETPALQLVTGCHGDRPGGRRRPSRRPVRGRGSQEVGDQSRLRLLCDHRHRHGAPVPPGRDRAGDRGRARGVLHLLRRAYRRREPV